MLEFQWDPVKAASNLQKHGVSFDYAARVFLDLRRQEGVATDMARSGGSPLEALRVTGCGFCKSA
jgi:uncharacterized DUF497 family protein